MKKRFQALVMSLMLLLSMSVNNTIFASDNITVKLNGQTLSFDVPPQIINGRTMVPMRAIFESLGATVEWNEITQTVTSVKGPTKIMLTVGNTIISVNSDIIAIDTPPRIVDGRTLVPVRVIAESFNLNVDWDADTKTVIINNSNKDISTHFRDLNIVYEHGNKLFKVFFGFSDSKKYNGTAKIIIENDAGEKVYHKEHKIDASKFGSYPDEAIGDILYKIEIPISQIKVGSKSEGTIKLDFFSDGISCESLESSFSYLPTSPTTTIDSIAYDKTFTLNKYLGANLHRRTKITSFEITDIEPTDSDELKVSFNITGTVSGFNYCDFDAKCYDKDGFLIGTGNIIKQVAKGEPFKFSDDFFIPDGTVRIEFADD